MSFSLEHPVDPALADAIRARAVALGFQSVGFVRAERYDDADLHLQAWLDAGYHGEMGYMERHRALRVDARALHEGTRTIIAVTTPYSPIVWDEGEVRLAAYAVGEDYHHVLRAKLLELAEAVESLVGRPVNARPIVDSAPLLERETARRGGLGWFGKSAMLVHPRHGTYTLLSGLLVDLELPANESLQPDRCGRCVRCLEVCPTGALLGDRVVDGSRCISYLTIELKGAIPRELRAKIGLHLFGCDLCQAVCPWNRFASETTMEALRAPAGSLPLDARTILGMSRPEFNARFRGTPMERSKRRGLARNAAVVLGNRRGPGDLDALVDALESHDEPLVRAHTIWALGEWRSVGGDAYLRARAAIQAAATRPENADLHEEITAALAAAPFEKG